jgi:hypothetical protein
VPRTGSLVRGAFFAPAQDAEEAIQILRLEKNRATR